MLRKCSGAGTVEKHYVYFAAKQLIRVTSLVHRCWDIFTFTLQVQKCWMLLFL